MITNWNQWVMGRICDAIAQANPWVEATICCRAAAQHLLDAGVPLHERVDVVHVMTLQHFVSMGHQFTGRVATVSSLHHIARDSNVADAMKADAIMGVSTPWMREMHRLGAPPEQTALVSLGVDTDLFAPVDPAQKARARRVAGLAPDAAVVGFIGKASSGGRVGRKNTPLFVEAMRAFGAREPRAAAVIVGPGWGPIVDEIRAAGVPVAYFPFITDYRALPRAYHLMDLFWTTSTIEGGPMTALESMSCGVCLLSTPVGVALDAVRDGDNGFLVPFHDADALVAPSVELMRSPDLRGRMAAAARQTMVERFQWKDTALGARELYGNALAGFAKRCGRSPAEARAAIDQAGDYPPLAHADTALAAVPRERWRVVRQINELSWAQHLEGMNAWGPALRHSLRGWALRPHSPRACANVLGTARRAAVRTLTAAGTVRTPRI
jgi:glycosyltransferase involved in cell wall biosynthesis